MTEEFKEIIKEEILKLPIEAQDAINGFDWVKNTEDIAKKYNLSGDETANLQAETLIILVGADYPNSFEENIKNNLRIKKTKAEQIETEVTEKIFKPIENITAKKIKDKLHGKEMTWDQSVNFILSGGNYLSLLKKPNEEKYTTPKTNTLIGKSNILSIKSNLLK